MTRTMTGPVGGRGATTDGLARGGRSWHNPRPAFVGTEAAAVVQSFFLRKLLARTGLARFVPTARRMLVGGEDYLRYYSDRTLAVPVDRLADPALFPDVHTPDSINLALGVPPCELPVSSVRGFTD